MSKMANYALEIEENMAMGNRSPQEVAELVLINEKEFTGNEVYLAKAYLALLTEITNGN